MQFSDFSSRYRQNSGTVQLMEDLGRATSTRGPIHQLGGGNPAHIPEVESLLRESMGEITRDAEVFGRMIGEYDAPEGNLGFRQALADMLREQFAWPVTPDNIAVTNGSQSSFG